MRNHFDFVKFGALSAVLLGGSLAVSAPPVSPPDRGTCCAASTSRLENLMNPNQGSDEAFFTASGGPPNVMMILDTSCSMNAWPEDWPTVKGCAHSGFAGQGYDSAIDYPSLVTGMTGPSGAKSPTYHSEWFNDGKVYKADGDSSFGGGHGSPMGHDFTSSGSPSVTTWGGANITAAIATACSTGLSYRVGSADNMACVACLGSAGYYVKDSSTRVATGNFLEFYAPKDVSAVMTLSNLIFSVREIRLGIITFDDWGGSCWGSSSVCLWKPMSPNCNQLFPFDTSSVESARNSILNDLAKNNDFSSYTPLASSLYAAAFHLRSYRVSDGFTNLGMSGFPSNTNFNEPNSANQYSICTGCSFNAAVILTDGEPFNELISSFPSQITSLGPTAGCPAGTGSCNNNLDEVAAFLWQKDIRSDLAGPQKVATYTIGFGTNTDANQLLTATARAGNGLYFNAKNAQNISSAFLTILDDIASRNNSFSSSAVAAVQTGSTATPALLPRMRPNKGFPWEGYLWRFEQYNEFVWSNDLNGDGDQEDVFIVDQGTTGTDGGPQWTVGNIVNETADGTFLRGDAGVAVPYWEGNAKLGSNLAGGSGAVAMGTGVGKRKVWTMFDTNGDGAFTSADTLTRIQVNSVAADDLKLGSYYGLRSNATACPSAAGTGALLGKFGLSISSAYAVAGWGGSWPGTPTQDDFDRLCARLVTTWILGADLYDVDGDANRAEPRANILGDIFHSSPVVIEPPLDSFLCDLGLSNQCVRTLYSNQLGVPETPNDTGTITNSSSCDPSTPTAYEAYVHNNRNREKLVVVGSNDGMIHAFISSRKVAENCVGGKPVVRYDADAANARAGLEVWAFMPPDQMPKVADLIISHQYMVDGDVMARDIWSDGSGAGAADGRKDYDEFHTLIVAAEGRGGKHYVALEAGYGNASFGASTPDLANDRPNFRWMFPQPCTPEAVSFGETHYSLSPKPPPVGPVLVSRSSLPGVNPLSGVTGVTRYGQETIEQWMVGLSGGWSPGLEKGRGIYFVDAWNGAINGRRDNLWWKFEFDQDAAGSFDQPAKYLLTSVPAPVAMVDYGANVDPKVDGFFDTAVFGDTFGQVWVGRFYAPGQFDNTSGLIKNWKVARSFEMDRDGVTSGSGGAETLSDGGTEAASSSPKSVANKSPFYYLPSVAIEPGVNKLRAFIGTGNRYAILDTGPGVCRYDNPLACAKSSCSETKVVSTFDSDFFKVNKDEVHFKSRSFEHSKMETSGAVSWSATLSDANTCGSTGAVEVKAENTDYKVGTCDYPTGADPNPGDVNKVKYECGLNAAGSTFQCTRTSVTRNLNNLVDVTAIDQTNLGDNRYFGFWAYGGSRVFVEENDGGTSPHTFDGVRLSDRSSASAYAGDLINVSNVSCTALGACDGGATSSDNGWFIDYGTMPIKTATGSAILSSCVLWSDISPTGGDGGTCGAQVTPASSIYQADFITGQPNCAYGFLPSDGGAYTRTQTRSVVAPPPEPTSVVQVSNNGQVRYSAMIVEPGKGQATNINVSGSQDVLQLVYQVPVPRSLHNCRHADGGCVVSP